MKRQTNCQYYVKCRECGWEGYTLLRGYENGYLYLKCEKCGTKNLYLNPPPKKDIIFIGGSLIQDLSHLITSSAKNCWTFLTSQPTTRKLALGIGTLTTAILILCLLTLKEYSYHLMAATLGTIASTIALVLRKGE